MLFGFLGWYTPKSERYQHWLPSSKSGAFYACLFPNSVYISLFTCWRVCYALNHYMGHFFSKISLIWITSLAAGVYLESGVVTFWLFTHLIALQTLLKKYFFLLYFQRILNKHLQLYLITLGIYTRYIPTLVFWGFSVFKQMYAIMGHVQSETQYPYYHTSTCCMRCPAYWKMIVRLMWRFLLCC